MPQISLLYVIFATLLKMYEFFLIYARKTAIIIQKSASFPEKHFGFAEVSRFPTFDICIFVFLKNLYNDIIYIIIYIILIIRFLLIYTILFLLALFLYHITSKT